MNKDSQIVRPADEPRDVRVDEVESADEVIARRYAPPQSTSAVDAHRKPMSYLGIALYIACASSLIAAALEIFPLGSQPSTWAIILGGVAGAYTFGRYSRSRWAGFGIGLVASFLAVGFAVYARHGFGG